MTTLYLLLLFLFHDDSVATHIAVANDPRRQFLAHQALARIEAAGPEEAIPATLEFVRARGHNALALRFTDFLGDYDDDRVRGLLVELLRDRDFYWRPTAAGALARQGRAAERDLFVEFATDPLWGVREACLEGLGRVADPGTAGAIRPHLADPVYNVRAAAARALHALGDEGGLPVLVEALSNTTRWFEVDYGQRAREDALAFLEPLAGDDFGFKPWESEDERADGLAAWQAWMSARDPVWRTKVPAAARSREDEAEYVFGFELRSCQRGDFFFRIDTAGNLVLGNFVLERAALSDEERRAFDASIEPLRALRSGTFRGRPGCDVETYYLATADGAFDRYTFGIEGRPAELDGFVFTVADLLDDRFDAATRKAFLARAGQFRAPE